MTTGACPTCSRPLDEHDRHVRFRWPDPVLEATAKERDAAWLSADDPNTASLMQLRDIGAFVRALLPARVPAPRCEWPPCNALPTWGLLGTPVTATVHDPDAIPYCSDSRDPQLAAVLRVEWPHEEVLSTLPD